MFWSVNKRINRHWKCTNLVRKHLLQLFCTSYANWNGNICWYITFTRTLLTFIPFLLHLVLQQNKVQFNLKIICLLCPAATGWSWIWLYVSDIWISYDKQGSSTLKRLITIFEDSFLLDHTRHFLIKIQMLIYGS